MKKRERKCKRANESERVGNFNGIFKTENLRQAIRLADKKKRNSNAHGGS